ERPSVSPLFLAPAAGSFVEFAISRIGEAAFLSAVTGADPAATLELEAAWIASLPVAVPPPRRAAPEGFHRGVCLAHTNSPNSGYGGEVLAETLDRLVSQGVEWISVTPFGFQRARDSLRIGHVLRGPYAETDEVMRRVIREAHARGLKVLYKPHLWVGHGEWTGEIEMKDEGAWMEWFDSYRRFIVHHAALAEEERAEVFCAANELVKTAGRKRPWLNTLSAIRKVFGGPLTYAANWGEEAEKVSFWDSLDFVGVNAYYPLSLNPDASDEALAAGARAVAERLEKVGRLSRRPVLITEMGFASRPACWVDPHREVREAAPDLSCQVRAYRAVLQAFTREPFRG
ncbi:MAG: glycoside hydrolase family 113, partial [Vicinamibacteria bacterium]